jgi:hypothetical protein
MAWTDKLAEFLRLNDGQQAYTGYPQMQVGLNKPRQAGYSTGFLEGATGAESMQPKNPITDPNYDQYAQGKNIGEAVGIGAMAVPGYAMALKAGAPKAYNALENYMVKSGGMIPLEAYHGTPNVMKNAFDITKAGTTSKANNFGHGIYFAESPDVAGMYMASRNKISGPSEGNLYKVDIPDALIPKMLNWYEDVPEDVRKKISAKAMEQFGSGISPTTGEKLYKEIAFSLKQAGSKTPEADASKWLLEQGIPGIKYENMQMVKGQGRDTNNYVMFDPTQVKMLDKFENKLDRRKLIESQIKALKDAGE